MKETIYTIPINEAFDTDCSCAVCAIENKLEKEQISYTLGPAMMEPDFRINSNKKGFCKAHYRALIEGRQALPLALILQTHTKEQNDLVLQNAIDNTPSKKGVFKKQSAEGDSAEKLINLIESNQSTCVICENISEKMHRYYNNIIYIWKTEADFKKKFASKSGFCLPHFAKLLKYAKSELGAKDFKEFYHTIVPMQIASQEQMHEDISAFVGLFDHNSDKKADENVKNSIRRAIQKYSSLNCEND